MRHRRRDQDDFQGDSEYHQLAQRLLRLQCWALVVLGVPAGLAGLVLFNVSASTWTSVGMPDLGIPDWLTGFVIPVALLYVWGIGTGLHRAPMIHGGLIYLSMILSGIAIPYAAVQASNWPGLIDGEIGFASMWVHFFISSFVLANILALWHWSRSLRFLLLISRRRVEDPLPVIRARRGLVDREWGRRLILARWSPVIWPSIYLMVLSLHSAY